MEFKTVNHSFDTYSEAEQFASTLLTFDQLMEKYRDMSIAQKQQFVVYKVQILGNYDTMLFIRYKLVEIASKIL